MRMQLLNALRSMGVLALCSVQLAAPNDAAAGATGSQEVYSDSIRTSQYVTVRDGTRFAIDIYRPAKGGQPVERKLPVILVATPYHRSAAGDRGRCPGNTSDTEWDFGCD
jgi:uncharacterized protein